MSDDAYRMARQAGAFGVANDLAAARERIEALEADRDYQRASAERAHADRIRLEAEVKRLTEEKRPYWLERACTAEARISAALARIRVSIEGKPRGDSGYMQSIIDRFVLDLRAVEEALRGEPAQGATGEVRVPPFHGPFPEPDSTAQGGSDLPAFGRCGADMAYTGETACRLPLGHDGPHREDQGEPEFSAVEDGEWIQPEKPRHPIKCCECGLEHGMEFRVVAGNVQFRAFRRTE